MPAFSFLPTPHRTDEPIPEMLETRKFKSNSLIQLDFQFPGSVFYPGSARKS